MHKGTIIVYDQPSAVVRHVEERTKNNGWNVSIPATRKALQKALLSQNDALIALLSRSTCDADFDLIDEARKFNPLIRIILILDQWDLKDVRRAMNKGAFDIIRQPVDLQSVTCAIEKALNQVMTGMIARQTKQELYLIHKELEIAARIQRSILPSDIRQVKSCAVFAEMLPAKEIAGDFYDYFVIDETRSAFVIGDVSGKGIPAALFMAVCRSLVKSTALQGWAPAECMSHVNRVLCEDNPDAMFVTLFYGILDSDKNRLDYCIGGHDSPFVIPASGEIFPLERTANMALGFENTVKYQSKSVYLNKGDCLFLYTDGITEAENPGHVLYGRERLKESLDSLKGKATEKIIKGVLRKVGSFITGASQSDDITAMIVRI